VVLPGVLAFLVTWYVVASVAPGEKGEGENPKPGADLEEEPGG